MTSDNGLELFALNNQNLLDNKSCFEFGNNSIENIHYRSIYEHLPTSDNNLNPTLCEGEWLAALYYLDKDISISNNCYSCSIFPIMPIWYRKYLIPIQIDYMARITINNSDDMIKHARNCILKDDAASSMCWWFYLSDIGEYCYHAKYAPDNYTLIIQSLNNPFSEIYGEGLFVFDTFKLRNNPPRYNIGDITQVKYTRIDRNIMANKPEIVEDGVCDLIYLGKSEHVS